MSLLKQHIPAQGIDYSTTDIRVLNYWVLCSRGSNMIRVSDGLIETSNDSGNSWTQSIAFTDANLIINAYIYSNGNINFFTTDNKIYKTDMSLSSVTEVPLLDKSRVSNYAFHTPQNASFPGAYFECEDHLSFFDDNIYILANYGNSVAINGGRGANATIVPFSDDFGETWSLTYEFGQNVVYTDDGTALGSSGGNLLGDSGNLNVCRHVHTIEKDPFTDVFYMNTGDRNNLSANPDMDEIGWYTGVYNQNSRTIDWTRIDFGAPIEQTDNLKATGMFFTSTHIYWGSDANPVTVPDNQGIWRSPKATFSDKNTHERFYPLSTEDAIINMKYNEESDIILATLVNSNTSDLNRLLAVKLSTGEGQVYTVPDNPILLRLNDVNEDGYMRLDFNGFSPLQNKTLLVKMGDNLFNNL